jgi:hypothetical protein
MGEIAGILESPPAPSENGFAAQEQRRGQVIQCLQRNSMFHYVTSPGEVDRGRSLVIGAAFAWDRYDLTLLADIEDGVERSAWPPIFVFDSDECRDLDDVAAWIGDLPGLVLTPFVALWLDGEIQQQHAGFTARQFVRTTLRLAH